MLGTAVAKRGVTIVLGSLHGLGTDQANKSKRIDRGVESYHADEYRDENFDSCVALLKNFHKRQNHANVIYISPQEVRQNSSKWNLILKQLALNGHITSFVIDEVHTVANADTNSFRPEFGQAVRAIKDLLALSK